MQTLVGILKDVPDIRQQMSHMNSSINYVNYADLTMQNQRR